MRTSGVTNRTGAASPGRLLQLVRSGHAHTRRELQRQTGLSRAVVGQRLDPLLNAGWLRETGVASSTGGRPPTRLEFDHQHAVVLTADMDMAHGRVGLLDLGGTILAERSGPL